jgi:hypothetical protein
MPSSDNQNPFLLSILSSLRFDSLAHLAVAAAPTDPVVMHILTHGFVLPNECLPHLVSLLNQIQADQPVNFDHAKSGVQSLLGTIVTSYACQYCQRQKQQLPLFFTSTEWQTLMELLKEMLISSPCLVC